MITLLELKNRIAADLDMKDVDEFIAPSTDIDMLYSLVFACGEGLDIRNVDKVKFLEANSSELVIEPMNEFLPEGNQVLNISLNHILKRGNSFTYRDFFDVFGPNSLLHSQIFIQELEWEIGDSLNIDFEYQDAKKRTVGELLHHLNNNHKRREEVIHKKSWWKFWT